MFILATDAIGNRYAINSDYVASISQDDSFVSIDMAKGRNILLQFKNKDTAEDMFNYIADKVRGVCK